MSLHKLYNILVRLQPIFWSKEIDAQLRKQNEPITPVESALWRYHFVSKRGYLEARQNIEQTLPKSQWIESLRDERIRRAEKKNPTLRIIKEGFQAFREVLRNGIERQWLVDNIKNPIAASQLWECLEGGDRVIIPGEVFTEDYYKHSKLFVCLTHELSLRDFDQYLNQNGAGTQDDHTSAQPSIGVRDDDAYIPYKKAIDLSNGVLSRKKLDKAINCGEPVRVRSKKPRENRRNVHIQDVLAVIEKLSNDDNIKEEASRMFGLYTETFRKKRTKQVNLD